ncbi:MAG TPA: FGGY family carbohydrate kinase, partial [Spirochaetia bacterium]|nr:FGGY family carbohydrate kinase [Spirochaetia bacterium]
MSKKYLIAIDVGVSFVKAGVYSADGSRVAVSTRPAPASQPRPGIFIQDADELFDLARDALRESVSESGVGASDVA